jgi:thioredoxin-related protein
MKSYRFLGLLVLVFAAMAFRFNSGDNEKKDSIKWITIQEAEKLNKKQPRKIVIDIYTDWCGWCKKMDKSTFADEKTAVYVNKHYYAVKLDAETKEEIVLNGKTYRFNPEYGVNQIAAELLQGKLGYPSTVYLDEKFNLLAPVIGFYDVKKFDNLLRYFAEDHYKNGSFDDFVAKKQ